MSFVWFAIPALAFVMFATSPAGAVVQPDGLDIVDATIGNGAEAVPGKNVVVNYTGWLFVNGVKGKKFDSSYDRGEPFTFQLGAERVIAGWDEGVVGMKVGGKRTLIIPPDLGYGATGIRGDIPPNATLIFDIDLVDVK